MKTTIRAAILLALTGAVATTIPAFAQVAPNGPATGLDIRTLATGDQVGRVYGRLATGATPADSAKAFLDANAKSLWAVDPADLAPYGPYEAAEHVLQIMPDRDTDGFKFTGLAYTQEVNGIPVYKGHLLLLVRNEPGFPTVLASSTLWDASAVRAQLGGRNLKQLPPERLWTRNALSQFRAQPEVGPARYVIWAGVDRVKAEPRLAVLFTAEGGGHWDPENHQRIEFVVDAETGAILHQESKIYHAVTGRVTGTATQGVGADTCNAEVAQGLPYIEVKQGTTVGYADVNGNFSFATAPASATYATRLVGQYFTTTNNSAATLTLSTTAADGTTWNPNFNTANTAEADRAQVNAYLESNRIRDRVLASAPTYPTVSTQTNAFLVNANLASTCNAYYTANTINFYLSGGGCANTAFGDVVHHEYGHNVVEKGGSGQGAYGEGFGDIHGLIMTDDPRTGVGFQVCTTGIRTAANTCQYSAGTACSSCGSEIHACGQLISGCVWDLRNRLQAAYPTTYRQKLADLSFNSILLHGAISTIASDITIDFLTLDDNNGNINDGTPNYQLINDSFSVHGLPGPALQAVTIAPIGTLPETVSPCGGATVQVSITQVSSPPVPSTAKLFAKVGAAASYTEYPLTQVSGSTYQASLPGGTCPSQLSYYFQVQAANGVVQTQPSAAAPYTATIAGGIANIASTDFEASAAGWVGGVTGDTATTGLWTRVDPVGTAAGSVIGQPEDDHTPAPGTQCWITGQGTVGGAIGANDIDGGVTTLISPAYNCTGYAESYVSYWRWYSNNSGSAPNADNMPVEISGDNGTTWVQLENVTENANVWVQKTFRIRDFITPTAQVRIRFRAQDTGTGSVVEAGVDDVRVYGVLCNPSSPDLNGDGRVDGADLGAMLGAWGTASADVTGDCIVDGADVGTLLGAWTP